MHASNRLTLNSSKTQLILFGTRQQLLKLEKPLLGEKLPSFTFSSEVSDLGVILDGTLKFTEHITNLTRSCYFRLSRFLVIRRLVSSSVFTSIVYAFICYHLDNCNPFAYTPPLAASLSSSILNAAVLLIARFSRFLSFVSHF